MNITCLPRRNTSTRLGDWVYSTRARLCGKKKVFGTVIVLVAKRWRKLLRAVQQNPPIVVVVNRPAGWFLSVPLTRTSYNSLACSGFRSHSKTSTSTLLKFQTCRKYVSRSGGLIRIRSLLLTSSGRVVP